MKVLLVQPAHPSNVRLFGRVYMSSLTLPVVAAATPPDVDVSIVDENVSSIPLEGRYDLVGITALTPNAPRAYAIADAFRARGVPVALGGVHPTLVPDEAAQHADIVVLGEAEEAWPRVLRDVERGSWERFYRGTRPELKGLGIPRRDLLRESRYYPVPKMEVSRGCPFNCSFCSTTAFFGRQMRYRPIEEVISEVRSLGRLPSALFFTDNNIVGNREYARELFQALIPLGIRWIGQASITAAHDMELLELAARSGCRALLIGFESLTPEGLAEMNKKVNQILDYQEAISRLHRRGIAVIGCFVVGLDSDDSSVFERVGSFIEETQIDVPQVTVLTPYPGTALREKLLAEGRIWDFDWSHYDVTRVTFHPAKMTARELQAGYDRLIRRLYNYPAILRRIARARAYLGGSAVGFLPTNIVYRRLCHPALRREERPFRPPRPARARPALRPLAEPATPKG
ncbi:MAG: B12-binding domain-containing radical SAM protein [Chloroflexia bacterium]